MLTLLSLITIHGVANAGGIQGRAARRGEVIENVLIYAYKDFGTGLKEGWVNVSEPTKVDGTYKLELPAGKYYLVARGAKSGGVELAEGDYYCYYSGAPVDVADDTFKNVGFNIIKVPKTLEDKKDKRSGVYGNITFEDKMLEKVYLFVYKSAENDFKGPPDYYFAAAKGKYKMRLPLGEYYLLARKRKKGGMFGPMEREDYFNYFYGNPVKVEKGVFKGGDIECITRLDMLEKAIDGASPRGITAQLTDSAGKPLKDLYLLVYTDPKMTGRPEYVSSRSDEDGKIFVELNRPGKYFLIARARLGGPAFEGEYYTKYSKNESSVTLSIKSMYKEVDFQVTKFKPVEIK